MKYSDESTKFFFLTPSIPLKFGGLTTALFRRADSFTKHFNNNVTVLTFKYSPNIDYIKTDLDNKGYTNDKVRLNNLYEYFSYSSTSERVEDPLLLFSEVEKTGPNEYKSEEYDLILMKSNKENNYFIKIECYNDEILQKIYELNEGKNLKRVRSFEKGNLVGELFYRNDQTVYMEKTFCGTPKSKTIEILLIERNGDLTKKFSTHKSLQKYWLSELLDEQKNNFLVVDGRALDSLVLDYNEKKTSKIFVVHSTHVREPFGTFSTLRLGNRTLLENIGQADNIVFLTNGQKNDIVKRFGDRPNYRVIPHFLEPDNTKVRNEKVKNRFVVISRFHEEKQLDHIIKAFSIVRAAGLDFTLNIFGDGATKQQLETSIDELGLQENVILKNFTSNPFHEFEISEGSILTSRYEGFGLTILESLISSCPVFAYDVKYGPSDMVESGYNGYLVEKNNINELADKLISYIKLPGAQKQLLMNNAVESAKNFNEESFARRWKEALDSANHNSNHRYKTAKQENIRCKLDYIGFSDGKLKTQISVRSATNEYKTLEKDCKGIQLEINNQYIEMDFKKRTADNQLIYESFIPFELLKKWMDIKRTSSIYYYLNLDNIIYKNRLKISTELNQSRESIQSYSKNIYQLIRKTDNVIELKKQNLDGLKGILRYIKHL